MPYFAYMHHYYRLYSRMYVYKYFICSQKNQRKYSFSLFLFVLRVSRFGFGFQFFSSSRVKVRIRLKVNLVIVIVIVSQFKQVHREKTSERKRKICSEKFPKRVLCSFYFTRVFHTYTYTYIFFTFTFLKQSKILLFSSVKKLLSSLLSGLVSSPLNTHINIVFILVDIQECSVKQPKV